jgi:NhaP-type Na+/H+ or K+/H+ antiporter
MADIFTTILDDFASKKYRTFGLSAYDFIGTFVIVFFIHLYMWNNPVDLSKKELTERTIFMYIASLLLLFITSIGLGVLFHYMFNQKSQLSYTLGFSGKRNIPNIINLI